MFLVVVLIILTLITILTFSMSTYGYFYMQNFHAQPTSIPSNVNDAQCYKVIDIS
jgi:hypothetical protein